MYLILAVSLFMSLISWSVCCSEQHVCLKDGTCRPIRNNSLSCGFQNSVSAAGWRMLNTTSTEESLLYAERGVCSPGLVQNIEPFSGFLECVRRRNYPNAYSTELASLNPEEESSYHRKHCGRWIDARKRLVGTTKWAFYDEDDVVEAVNNQILGRGAAALGKTDLAKFRVSCKAMLASSHGVGAAAQKAYEHLMSEMPSDLETNADSALTGLGVLSSHFCDAPALVGLSFENDLLVLKIADGIDIKTSVLSESLYAMGGSRRELDDLKAFAELMQTVPDDTASESDALAVIYGSYKGSYVESAASALNPVRTSIPPTLNVLHKFTSVLRLANFGGSQRAAAYVKGLAATCALQIRTNIDGSFGQLQVNSEQATHAALGRMHTPPEVDRFKDVDGEHVFNASRSTWSTTSATPRDLTGSGSIRARCLDLGRMAFLDDFDRAAYELLVTEQLSERIQTMTADVRERVAAEMEVEGNIGRIFSGNADRAWAAAQVRLASVRISGAPRSNWAGSKLPKFVRPDLGSSDGALVILLKQARAVYLDRAVRAVRHNHPCTMPSLFDSSSRNAYLLVSENVMCSMLLPGIIVAPFADERYDDASLYSRLGYIIGHEFSHVTALQHKWQNLYADQLLKGYEVSTYTEGIADLGAAQAVLSTGKVGAVELCAHISQLWCGRTGELDEYMVSSEGLSHPVANFRGDQICKFLLES